MNADNVLEDGDRLEKSGRSEKAAQLYLDCLDGCNDPTVRLIMGSRLRRLAPSGSELEDAVHERVRVIEARILEHRKHSKELTEDLTAIVAIASAWEEPSSVRRILRALRENEADVYETALTFFASNVPEFVELDEHDAAILRRAPVRAYEADREFLRKHPDSPQRMEREFAQIRAANAVAFAAALALNNRLLVAKSLVGDLIAADRQSGCPSLLEAVADFPVRDVRTLICEACGRPPSCAEEESVQPSANP